MLAKSKRLNLKKSFKWVAQGRSIQTKNLKLMFRDGENSSALVGIALSGSQFKKAHDRNRARRLTSKAIEELYPQLPKGVNLVIIPRAGVLETKIDLLKKEIEDVKALFTSD